MNMDKSQQNYDVAIVSLTGGRSNNQDRAIILRDDKTVVLALGDGLGGHPRGEFAAQLFIDTCERMFNEYPKPLTDPLDFMLNAVEQSHDAILNFGSRQTPPISPRTTAVVAIIQLGVLYWLHVGDSRLYLVRDNKLHALTKDHAIVKEVETKRGKVIRRSGVTRCLGSVNGPCGGSNGNPIKLKPNDALLLSSDGLWDQVTDNDVIGALSSSNPFPAEVKMLAKLAESNRGPKSDNVTGVGLKLHKKQTIKSSAHNDPLLDVAVEQLKGMVDRITKS